MSKRVAQIESTLQRAIAQVLQRDLADPRVIGLVSITRVHVSPDLHQAEVYVSVLPDKHGRRVHQALQHAAKHIQSLVRKRVAMRQVPHLDFRLDESLKKQSEIHGAIREALDRSGVEPTDGDGDAEHQEQP